MANEAATGPTAILREHLQQRARFAAPHSAAPCCSGRPNVVGLWVCQDEAGIAVVMGHEVAHAYQEHGRKRVSTQVLAQATLEAAEAALSSSTENETLRGLTMGALGLGVQFGGLAFSRSDESAADHGGLILMAEAGYDPRPAVDFWKRMSAASGGEAPPEFMSTHPHHDTRINDLQEKMPKALAIYERTKGGN